MGIYISIPNADFSEVAVDKVDITNDGRVNINVVSDDESLGTVSGSGLYKLGQQVVLNAIPIGDNVFSCWNDDYNEPSKRSIVARRNTTYIAYFNTDQGYRANILSNGEFEVTQPNNLMYATSTLKRRITGEVIKINYSSFIAGTASGSNLYQLKIGEYDVNGAWIQRQVKVISPDGGYVEFIPNSKTDSILICLQLNSNGAPIELSDNVALVYNSLVIEKGVLNKKDVGSFMYSKLVNYV